MELRPEEITKIIRSQIKNYENKLQTSETGGIYERKRTHADGRVLENKGLSVFYPDSV